MKKLKTNKGITLIALIITIIVLLILATVSIKLLIDQGIITRSQNATSKYSAEQEKELITLAYTDYKMAKVEDGDATLIVEGATVSGNETSGWTITFDKTGNRYTFDPSQGVPKSKPKTEEEKLLEKYFLGKNENGENKILTDVIVELAQNPLECKFIGNKIIPEASTKIKIIDVNGDNEYVYLYITYQEKIYKLQVSAETMENTAVELVYAPTGREGEKVKYSYDGTAENEKEWTILYDYGDSVEIISPEVMGGFEIGGVDSEAQNVGDLDKNGEANTYVDKAIYSYNNMISRFNNSCASLVTNSNKISVRNVGSNPYNPSAEGKMYESEKLLQWSDGKYNGIVRGPDNNAEQDLIRMTYHEVAAIGEHYGLSSRMMIEFSNDIYFEGGCVNDIGGKGSIGLVYICENSVSASHTLSYVRPVVKISSDSIKY